MPFTQQTFLGASIQSFNGTIGWGENPSSVTVQLVEDVSNGDSFSTPSVGDSAIFIYGGWGFAGLLQNWSQEASFNGNPTYQVTLQDPREVLAGVQIILSGYNGSVLGMPNLYNVYGYIENTFGFGSAGVNEAGIKWQLIRDALVAISLSNSSIYGGPIGVRNSTFKLNLSGLPELPEYYRIPAENMSVMDFIREVCDAANHDFFFQQATATGTNDELTLVTIDRNVAPSFGAINTFIASTAGAVEKSAGFEFRNEVTSKFVVGGNLSQIFVNTPSPAGQDPEDEAIWPFWGFDDSGNLIVGEGEDDNHRFDIPAKWLRFWPFNTYPTNVGEIRAAEESQEAWESYLLLYNWNYYIIDPTGTMTDVYRDYSDLAPGNPTGKDRYLPEKFGGSNVSYTHNEELNPHFGKATILNLAGMLNQDVALFLTAKTWAEIQKSPISQWAVFGQGNMRNAHNGKNPKSLLEEGISVIYEYIKGYATQFYGRKFMVRMPFMLSSRDSETGKIINSQDPTDSGFIEESAWDDAIANNLLPLDVNKMTTADGRILAYVKYDNALNLDLSALSEYQDYVLNANATSAFVLVQVDEKVVYTDNTTLFSPRAVITLPNAVRHANDDHTKMKNYLGIVVNFLQTSLKDPARPDGAQTQANIDTGINKLFGNIAADRLKLGNEGLALIPDLVAVPLSSNIQFYGPWTAIGANGPMSFEKDDSLVPWNYGGFSAMNNAGNAKVTSSISLQQVSEKGSVQYPDVPQISLGGQLLLGGPYITDINVSVGQGGTSTTYNMNTWVVHPYRLRKSQAEFQTRLAKTLQTRRRNIRNLLRQPVRGKVLLNPKAFPKPKVPKVTNKTTSSKYMIAGQLYEPASGDWKSMVAIQSDYDSMSQVQEDLTEKAFMSLDGLFRPATTDYNSTHLPHFESGTGDISSVQLNPFSDADHDIQILTQDSGVLAEDYINDRGNLTGEARFIAHRMPMIGTGWGYDTGGNPVPGASGGDFVENYKKRNDLWKTGPIDLRWDDTAKVWKAPGGSEIKHINGLRLTIAAEGTSVSSEGQYQGNMSPSANNSNLLFHGSTLYLAQYSGREISLYKNGEWGLYSIGLLEGNTTASFNVGGLDADKRYNVYAFTKTVAGLEVVDIDVNEQTADALVAPFESVLVHDSGGELIPERRYVGQIYMSKLGSQTTLQDNSVNRHIYNFYNRVHLGLFLPASGITSNVDVKEDQNIFDQEPYANSGFRVSGVSFINPGFPLNKHPVEYDISCHVTLEGSGICKITMDTPFSFPKLYKHSCMSSVQDDGINTFSLKVSDGGSNAVLTSLHTVIPTLSSAGLGTLGNLQRYVDTGNTNDVYSYITGWVYQ